MRIERVSTQIFEVNHRRRIQGRDCMAPSHRHLKMQDVLLLSEMQLFEAPSRAEDPLHHQLKNVH